MDVVRKFALWPDPVLPGQSVRRADSDLITCPTFHWLGRTDHKLVRVCLRFVNRPSYWKFNTRDMGLCDAAGKPNSEGVSGGGYWE